MDPTTRQTPSQTPDPNPRPIFRGSHYDYTHQAWTVDGRYVTCGHPAMNHCACYGRMHAGEPITLPANIGGRYYAPLDPTKTAATQPYESTQAARRIGIDQERAMRQQDALSPQERDRIFSVAVEQLQAQQQQDAQQAQDEAAAFAELRRVCGGI